MYYWIVTYVPLGHTHITEKTEVKGNTKLDAQEYFSKYYVGKIVSIERRP